MKHTPIVTKEEEEMLWSKKVMGVDLPRQLQRTIFFYVGKVFCLRGGVEQRALKPSQFQRRHGPDHYVYIENGSKNNPGTTVRVENKVVPVYRNQNSGRCVVSLLDKYLSKISHRAPSMSGTAGRSSSCISLSDILMSFWEVWRHTLKLTLPSYSPALSLHHSLTTFIA